jgi:hypothetical protein
VNEKSFFYVDEQQQKKLFSSHIQKRNGMKSCQVCKYLAISEHWCQVRYVKQKTLFQWRVN